MIIKNFWKRAAVFGMAGAMLMCILIGWKVGFPWMEDEVLADGRKWNAAGFFKVCVKYVAPILMAFVLVSLFLSYLGV